MQSNSTSYSPRYRLIYNDDGHGSLLRSFFMESSPLTPQRFLDVTIAPLRNTPVDALFWCVGHDMTYVYNTDVGESYGHNVDTFQSMFMAAYHEASKTLIQNGYDPLELVTKAGHEAGIDVYATIRMNDLHASVPSYSEFLADFKKEHPEFLLGSPDNEGKMSRLALNYAYSPVREHRLAVISELIRKFEIDGIELDFMRFPFYFPNDTAYAYRHTMTAFIRQIRSRMQELTKTRDRAFYLGIRVPDTLSLALRIGLDVKTWLAEGLVDLVSISGGYYSFGTPFNDIGSAAHLYNRPAYACLSIANSDFQDRNQFRAAAYRAWQQGIDGLYLFNYVYLLHDDQGQSMEEVFSLLNDLGDPDKLSWLNKTYALDQSLSAPGKPRMVSEAHDHAAWEGQRPLKITHAGDGIGQTVTFEIGDNLEDFSDEERPKVTLWIRFRELHAKDEVEFYWNGDRLYMEAGKALINADPLNYFCDFEFFLDPKKVHHGENSLETRLIKRADNLMPYIILEQAQVRIDFECLSGSVDNRDRPGS